VPWGAFNAAISSYTAQNTGAGRKDRLRPVYGIQFVWYASPIGWFANLFISYSHLRKTESFRKQV
jgi:hypothetical protein